MSETEAKSILKGGLSIFFGFITIIFGSLFAIIIFSEYPQGNTLLLIWLFLCISLIVSLIFINVINSKKIYYLLSMPIICFITIVSILQYQNCVDKIPTVEEQNSDLLYFYEPFLSYNKLPKLDKISTLRLEGNLPILDGATALYPLYASFVQAVYPKGNYKIEDSIVLCSKTPNAYNNLLERKVDIIFCFEPSENQIKQFINKGLKLKMYAIGRDAFVFFVNTNNNINNLSIENVQGIYSGSIKNWSELNGMNKNIRAFQREKDSGSQTILERIMDNIPIEKPRRENISRGMGSIINQVASYKNYNNAIGYSFLLYSTEMVKNNQIKLLQINGIIPTKETIKNNSYPLSQDIYVITIDEEKENESIQLFIEWILSRQGQELIFKTGYIPVLD